MRRAKLVPILLAVAVLGSVVAFLKLKGSGDAGPAGGDSVSEQRLGGNQQRRLGGPASVDQRAADFPHNLKTFADWETITAEEMAEYRVSLSARVGRWEAEEVQAFYFRSVGAIKDPGALREFRQAVLGVWCAKDVGRCLDELSERADVAAKQDALAAWGRDDWLGGLRYLQATGDQVIEARLGGDCTRFVKNLISGIARANGVDEAAEVAAFLRSVKNQEAAAVALEAIRNE